MFDERVPLVVRERVGVLAAQVDGGRDVGAALREAALLAYMAGRVDGRLSESRERRVMREQGL